MIADLKELFDKHKYEFLKSDRVENPLHLCSDVSALLLLHKLAPRGRATVGAEHNKIWLAASAREVQENATEEQIVTLIRCGVRFDDELDKLYLFV